MAIRDVYIPERRQNNALGNISSGLGIFSGIKGMMPAKEAVSPTPKGSPSPSPAPAPASPAPTGAETGAAGTETGGGMGAGSYALWGGTALAAGSGIYDVYHASQGNQSRSDMNRYVKDQYGEDLLDWGLVPGEPGKKGVKDQGADYIFKFGQSRDLAKKEFTNTGRDPHVKPEKYGYSDAMAKRMESTKQLSPDRIRAASIQVEQMDLPRADKDAILGKLGQAFAIASQGISKFKV